MAIRKFKYQMVWLLAMLFVFAGIDAQTITFTHKNVTCNGGSDGEITVTITGGASTYRYVYYKTFMPSESDSFGPTTNLSHTFTGFGPDYYTVFVRDVITDNVLDFNTIQVTQPAVLSATVASTNINCFNANNGTITISSPTGGSGAYEFSVNGGGSWQVSGNFTGLPPATYVVQIRDRNAPGCIRTLNAALVITQFAQLNATVTATNVTCFGKNNGSIVISSPTGGSGAYQYSRNGGVTWQAGGTFSPLAPGTYNIVMRDAAVPTCTRTLNGALQITQPAQLQVTDINIIKGVTCNESSDGQLQAVVVGGTAPYTYDWYINTAPSVWTTINQHNQSATNLPKGWYEVRVNDANNCGSPTPASAREVFLEGATDSIPPVFIFDSAAVVSTCQGQSNGSITIYAHGGVSPARYSITTGGGSGYQGSNLFSNLAGGAYQTWAMDRKGCKKSGPVKTVVTTPNSPVSVSITANPPGSICPGTSVLFTANPVNGGTTPAYQWRLNGSPVGSGVPTYSNSTLAAGDQVRVILTSSLRCTSGNPATSNTITASLLSPPAITGQPVSLVQCAGTNATFTVTATGSGITYQWRKNGVNIAGAINASYTINNIGPADAAGYTVVITGTCGTVTSNVATLTISTAPAITSQPASITQCAGTNATFTVTATGTGLTYQWRKGGVIIAGAVNPSYTINNIAPADAGIFDVVITGTCGTITSNTATLTVNTAPAITGQPVSLTQCTGTNATFTVTATGAGLTYQWRKNGAIIGGAINASYTINNIAPADAATYTVLITGTCGTVTSNGATLTVQTAPVITAQPVSIAQCSGTDATFTVTATGPGLAWQWRKNGVNIAGANNASYTISNIGPADAATYSVVITGTCGSITSNGATLTVNTAPVITAQPASQSLCTGANVTFTVTATGPGLTYQWRKNGVNIPGALNASYTINNIAPADAANYDAVVTGTCGSVTSAIAILTVNTAPSITVQPVSLVQCTGTNATFTVTATGTGLTYQWRKNGVNIPGAINVAYTINNIALVDAATYTVLITGTCGTVTSNSATLTVNTPPAITGQPAALILCPGANATFTVNATGAGLAYQWRKNGSDIPGATFSSYTINNISSADAGNYDVMITGTCGNLASNVANLTVNAAPAITTQPVSLTQCAGTDATFSVTATGTGISYQWRRNGVNIPGATGNSHTINNINPASAGSYTVVITGTCGTLTSNAAVLAVDEAPAITTQPVPVVSCEGTTVIFSVNSTGAGLNYQWRKNGLNIGGATSQSLTLTNIASSAAGNYDVVITGTCGTATSNAASLTVAEQPQITVQPMDQEICEGSDVTFSITASGTALSYQWRRNGTNLPGETTPILSITDALFGQSGNYDVLVYGMCDTLTSSTAVLLVDPATAVLSSDEDTLVCEGSTVQFNITANGFGPKTYQWQWLYTGTWIDLSDGGDISGVSTPDLRIQNVEAADSGYYRCFVTSGCGSAYSDSVNLDVNLIVATIGTPAPFLIDSTSTLIQVGVKVTDRFLNWDLGFALVAPDGTEVVLKSPLPFWCVLNPFNNGVDGQFTNDIDPASGDTLDYCVLSKPITGTFAATGNWNVLHGKDPANGAWQVRVYDADKSVPDPDGFIRLASLSFTDLDANGDTAVIRYNSGNINEGILNPISGELRPTSFVVPIRLMTSCFNSQDARAVVTVKGGIAPYTYQWSGPTSVPDAAQVDLGAGTYTVTVTDALGCSSVASVDVSAPPAIIIDDVSTSDTLICFNSADGYIRAKASGGTGEISYRLLPGNIPSAVADSGVFLNLTGGTYTLRATDINGCSLDTVITIERRPELTVQIDLVPVVGTESGSITLTAAGGTPPYRYSIDNGTTLHSSGVFDSLSAGIYPVYVEDTNGCTFSEDVNLSIIELHVTVIKHDISCYGAADGDFLLTTVDGVAPYTLTGSWLTDPYVSADGLISFTGQTSGIYDLWITDSEGAMFIDTVELVEPEEILAVATITDASCTSLTLDGAISLAAGGGAGSLSYSWNSGETTRDLTGIEAGNYEVTITDTNLCSALFTFTVPGTNSAVANAGIDDTICPGSEYQLIGNIGDSVHWEPALVTDDPDIFNPTISIMTATPFFYTVYQNGCTDRDTVVISAFEHIGMDIYDPSNEVNIDTALYLLEGEMYTMAATPGFESYLWDPATWLSDPTSQAVLVSSADNIWYTVYGTTADGCVETDFVHVVIARKIEIFTGFSPNGDSFNDKWVIRHAEEYGERIHVKVFNRWGEPVFESRGYGGSDEWDGTRNGRPMPVGAYYYIIDVDDGKSKPYTGTVTILR